MSQRITLKKISTEAKLLLIGIPVLLWTIIPVYHLVLFAISPRDQATTGQLWPKNPTWQNFDFVFNQKHFYLDHFWTQMWNSVLIAGAVGAITLFIATSAAFAISRLKLAGGRWVMNLALFTYFIPAAFLAVPMYKTMGNYGLLNNQWSLILAMVTIASPYCIWVLKQASDKLPWELDEAARMDGATPLQLFRLVYLPLMVPAWWRWAPMRCCWPGMNTSTPSCCGATTTRSRWRWRWATSCRPTIHRGSC